MSIWGKLAGAPEELAKGGPIGALGGGLAENQMAFTVGLFSLGAKMAKADGVVTMDEINAFKEVVKIPAGEMKNVADIFNLAKKDVTGYEAYAEQLAAMLKGNRKLLEDVLEGLFHIAKADQVLHPREVEFLAQVAERFGISKTEFSYGHRKARRYKRGGVCPNYQGPRREQRGRAISFCMAAEHWR